jgi:predicted DNA-binding transcriptional regulator YafY
LTAERRARLDDMIRLFKQSGRGWTVHELAQHYHLSERQVRYDLAEIMGNPDYAPLVTRCQVRREYLHMATAYREGCR